MNRQQAATDRMLRMLPSHGWTAGWIGRRDRALVVLSQAADLPYEQIAWLCAGDINVADGEAIIKGPTGPTTIGASTESLLCAPCALARWLHALDLTVVYTDTNVIASVIGRAAPLTARSPHVCENPSPISAATFDVPVLPVIDRWGLLAPQPSSARPHPRSQRTRGAEPVAVHRPVSGRASEVGTSERPVAGSHRAHLVTEGALGTVTGVDSGPIAPTADLAELRAGQLEKRLRQLMDRAASLEN